MNENFRAASRVLGRREALKYGALGVLGVLVATACGDDGSNGSSTGGKPGGGVAKQALNAFAVGEWKVNIDYGSNSDPAAAKPLITVTVDAGGTYTVDIPEEFANDVQLSSDGTWTLAGGKLDVRNGTRRTASAQVPETVTPDTATFGWSASETDPDSNTDFTVSATWAAASNTLIITGKNSGNSEDSPVTVTAIKQ